MAKSKTVTLTKKKLMDVYMAIHQNILNRRILFLKHPPSQSVDLDAEMCSLEQDIYRNVKFVLETNEKDEKATMMNIESAKKHIRGSVSAKTM